MEQCVMITGTMKMPLLSAHNLDSLAMVNLMLYCIVAFFNIYFILVTCDRAFTIILYRCYCSTYWIIQWSIACCPK